VSMFEKCRHASSPVPGNARKKNRSTRAVGEKPKVITFLTQCDIRRDCQNKYPSFINRERIPHVVIKPSHHTSFAEAKTLTPLTSLLLYCNRRDR
jgi:hypothetical protein